jgi:hypothetical protein
MGRVEGKVTIITGGASTRLITKQRNHSRA